MAPTRILYLAVEGVLLPRSVRPNPLEFKSSLGHAAQLQLALLVEAVGDVRIVLSSDWIHQLGYRTVLEFLVPSLRERTIGATVPGNKVLGRRLSNGAAGLSHHLERDFVKRRPQMFAVLEQDARRIPLRLRSDSVIVERGLWCATQTDWDELCDLLKGGS